MHMQTMTKRTFLAAACALAASGAMAAGYPDKPVKLVIPYAPGGPTDVLGRLVAEHLGARLKQTILVENKPGAGGVLAMAQVAKSRADGYTLLLGDMNLAVAPALNKHLPFDPVTDFTPIAMIATAPMLMLVPASSSVQTPQEWVALAQSKAGQLSYASAGVGSPTHLAAEVFKARYGVDLTHIPYPGSGPAMTSVASGDTALIFTGISGARPLVEAGKLRAIAITGDSRAPSMPQLPTLAEAGTPLPELSVGSWWGLLAPAGLPQPIAQQLKQALDAAVASPALSARLAHLNYTQAAPDTDFRAWVAKETRMWTQVMRKAGIQPE